MNFKVLSKVVKREVDRRGGAKAVLADAKRAQAAMKGGGTAADKAKRAAEVLKDGQPGRRPRSR